MDEVQADAQRHWAPPGSAYSPLVDPREGVRRSAQANARLDRSIAGVDMRTEDQVALIEDLLRLHRPESVGVEPAGAARWTRGNSFYPLGDAYVLQAVVRRQRPRRVIEVGGGYSTAALLDAIDMDGRADEVQITVVEPDPDRLASLLREGDTARLEVMVGEIQDLELERYDELGAGDLLLIDSSHVLKTGSDVQLLLFEALPRLAPGALVHFHDVPWPFEYPPEWIAEGRSWNEAYAVRAFLQFNSAFGVALHLSHLAALDRQRLARSSPELAAEAGSSLWIERLR
ncbi:class I SAM-dependent methyltransferase [Engelhardtia mirabilis]|uniref:Class I SAM-dependent methyltransferase n=1 Tax=Engelhardtia mirabilis TaxID=2528011 RepID=A0A518BSL3_9BACT|nr:hypothetical protein Pla133_50860 [Planctomycetes bacterium Pla133]QDV04288.1 hypothetical protein Pla86_50830 [Planctomycetes bacterium Pla86]